MKGLHLHVDCASGAAGDMMLGALIDLGVPVEAIGDALDAVGAGRGRLHVETIVKPALASGTVVITDRYVDSSLAYQGGGRDAVDPDLESMLRWATGDLRPDLTVVLDLEPDTGLARFAERDRIEAEGADFHRRVRAHFLELAEADPAHYVVLDARLAPEEIAAAVLERVVSLR